MSQELVLVSAIYCILSNSFENSAKYRYCIKKVWFVSCSIYTHRQIIRHPQASSSEQTYDVRYIVRFDG